MQEFAKEKEAECETLKSHLLHAETSLEEKEFEVERLTEVLRTREKRSKVECEPKRIDQEQMETLLAEHTAQIQTLRKTNSHLQKAVLRLNSDCEQKDCTIDAQKLTIRKLNEDTAKLRSKEKELKTEICDLKKQLEAVEDRAKFVEFDLSLSQRKVAKLEEEVKVLTTTGEDGNEHERHASLMAKLKAVEESQEDSDALAEDDEEPTEPSNATSLRRDLSLDFGNQSSDDLFSSSLTLTGRTRPPFMFADLQLTPLPPISVFAGTGRKVCTVELGLTVGVPGRKSHRKDPSEEYFTLVLPT